jgi:hypothetical protein
MLAPWIQSSQEPLDLEFTFANAGGLVPVYLREHNLAVSQPHPSDAFALAPSTAAIVPAQARKFSDAGAGSDRLDCRELANDFEVHGTIVANTIELVKLTDTSSLTRHFADPAAARMNPGRRNGPH